MLKLPFFLRASAVVWLLCTSGSATYAQTAARTDGLAQESVDAPLLEASSDLRSYVQAPDASYRWELRERSTIRNCDVLRLHLTSQTWHDVKWKHVLYLIKPPGLDPQRHDAVLVVGGGSWSADWPENGPEQVSPRREAELMTNVATQFGCVIAVVSHIPFQPMMGGKKEDEIIAATFDNYLKTQDATWPLLLPMVKAAVRAMDATCAASQEFWNVDLQEFTVTGASKRGWTTWLTGAVDPRVTGIAPMVIDMLNMNEQMKLQVSTWGTYSEQIADYTELQLPKLLATPAGQSLQRIVDPFAYRKTLQQPKLLIFGTNDRYWPLDACNVYWDQLSGDKYLLYVPNNGHGIDDYARVIGSLSALHRSLHGQSQLPKLDWEFKSDDDGVELDVTAVGDIDSVRGWVAIAPTLDFRDARWVEQACTSVGNDCWRLSLAKPADGFIACFAETVCVQDNLPAFFSTNVQIFPAQGPAAK